MVRAVVLALLVGLALPLGVAGSPADGAPTVASASTAASAPTAVVDPSLQDIAILTVGDDARADFATPSMDVATAMTLQREATDARLEQYALSERLERTPSTERRKALLFEAATRVEIRIAALRDEERALRVAYANRELETGAYLRRSALIHARASELQTTLEVIQRRAAEIPRFSLRSRVSLLGAGLFGFEGPVRARALESFRGDRPPTRIHVQASERGVVLSVAEGDRFVREAYRADHRRPETVSSRSLNDALEWAQELYPVAYNTSSYRTGINTLSGGVFLIDIQLGAGQITAYLDGTSEEVFFEVQERRLDLLGPRPTATGAANGTRLVVNRSFAGGPLRITVRDNETGEPLSVPVYVDGHRVETGPDGSVWTLSPAGITYPIRAVGPRGNVTIDVRPLAPRTVDTEE